MNWEWAVVICCVIWALTLLCISAMITVIKPREDQNDN